MIIANDKADSMPTSKRAIDKPVGADRQVSLFPAICVAPRPTVRCSALERAQDLHRRIRARHQWVLDLYDSDD